MSLFVLHEITIIIMECGRSRFAQDRLVFDKELRAPRFDVLNITFLLQCNIKYMSHMILNNEL